MSSIDRSVADVLRDIVGNIQEIVRAEVRLAKSEVREELTKVQNAGLLLGLGAIGGLFAVFFLLFSLVYALSIVVPNWAAALTVGAVLAITAAAILSVGMKRFGRVHPIPDRTIESVKENVQWAKQQSK